MKRKTADQRHREFTRAARYWPWGRYRDRELLDHERQDGAFFDEEEAKRLGQAKADEQ